MEERLLAILRLAQKYNASDIHFTLRGNDLSIEMRVEDHLRKVKSNFGDYKLIRYLQYLANLDLGKLLLPQTGQFEMEVDGILLSLRFAVINTHHYTNGVLRILNSQININVDDLSSDKKQNEYFKSLLKYDNGLIIFSGPTGSGKTTTIYSLLKDVKEYSIYTIEDPIEIYNDNFIQLEVNEAIGFSYAEGIKQILRHDPDIIVIGEIRDKDSAKMAVEAANTGHLVFASIHASSASGIIARMNDLGVKVDNLYDVALSLISQRMLYEKDNHKRRIVYEIMDKKEIDYFYKNHKHSSTFNSLNKQIDQGLKNNIYEIL